MEQLLQETVEVKVETVQETTQVVEEAETVALVVAEEQSLLT
jgi:hypothetical protein